MSVDEVGAVSYLGFSQGFVLRSRYIYRWICTLRYASCICIPYGPPPYDRHRHQGRMGYIGRVRAHDDLHPAIRRTASTLLGFDRRRRWVFYVVVARRHVTLSGRSDDRLGYCSLHFAACKLASPLHYRCRCPRLLMFPISILIPARVVVVIPYQSIVL